jgi:methionine--tRNA ligase beta chain
MTTIKVTPVKPTISIDVLEKIDIRVGTIKLVEEVEGSDKLVRLIVDFGDDKRSVLVGMKKEGQNPEEIEGKQALFVVNLEPRKMMGEVSEAMIFDIGYADGIRPVLGKLGFMLFYDGIGETIAGSIGFAQPPMGFTIPEFTPSTLGLIVGVTLLVIISQVRHNNRQKD